MECSKPLVISLGFNGYQWIYERNTMTQSAYCERCGFDFVMVKKPAFTSMLMECAWLKIPLLLAALAAKRPWVLFVDADVEIKKNAPSFLVNDEQGKDIFLVNGYSGRVNSGVIMVKNTERIRDLLSLMYSNALKAVSAESDVGWGENGHVIEYTKEYPGLQIVDRCWNNNVDPELDDYFRHYSAGPMRKYFELSVKEKCISYLSHKYMRFSNKNKMGFQDSMEVLMLEIQNYYSEYFPLEFDKVSGKSVAKQ